jgi:hypothetical protein
METRVVVFDSRRRKQHWFPIKGLDKPIAMKTANAYHVFGIFARGVKP